MYDSLFGKFLKNQFTSGLLIEKIYMRWSISVSVKVRSSTDEYHMKFNPSLYVLRPTSVIRKTDIIFFGSMKSHSGSRVGDSGSFIDMIS